ncbi:hypothetical protein KAS50_00450, partial [bacterium]|nr:hypothetical protein [bacterium]
MKRMLLFTVMLLFSLSVSLYAQAPNLNQLGSIFNGTGPANIVHVKGDTAYVGVGSNVHILDVSVPSSITVLMNNPVLRNIQSIETHNDTLVFFATDDGISIYNIYTSSWYEETSYGGLMDIKLSGQYAYALMHGGDLRILDITTLSSLSPVGLLSMGGNPSKIALKNDTVYAAMSGDGLKVIDVSTPSSPVLIGSTPSGGGKNYIDIAVDNSSSTVFITDWSGDLLSIDVTPDSVKIDSMHSLDSLKISNKSLNAIDLKDDTIITTVNDSIYIIDATIPSSLSLINKISVVPGSQAINDIEVVDDIIYAAAGESGVSLYSLPSAVSGTTNEIGQFSTGGMLNDITAEGDLIFVAKGVEGVK